MNGVDKFLKYTFTLFYILYYILLLFINDLKNRKKMEKWLIPQ